MGSLYVVHSLFCAELAYYWLLGILLLPTVLTHWVSDKKVSGQSL